MPIESKPGIADPVDDSFIDLDTVQRQRDGLVCATDRYCVPVIRLEGKWPWTSPTERFDDGVIHRQSGQFAIATGHPANADPFGLKQKSHSTHSRTDIDFPRLIEEFILDRLVAKERAFARQQRFIELVRRIASFPRPRPNDALSGFPRGFEFRCRARPFTGRTRLPAPQQIAIAQPDGTRNHRMSGDSDVAIKRTGIAGTRQCQPRAELKPVSVDPHRVQVDRYRDGIRRCRDRHSIERRSARSMCKRTKSFVELFSEVIQYADLSC